MMPTLILKLALCVVALAASGFSWAQTPSGPSYPSRPITFISPQAPGSGADVIARTVAESVSRALNTSIVVENVQGASGLIGVEKGRRSTPDGYTFVVMTDATYIFLPLLMKSATFDPMTDFEPVSVLGELDYVLVTNPDFPARTLKDLVAVVKSSPHKLTYATGGVGSAQHFGMEFLASKTGMVLEQIPYKGAVPAVTAVAAGEVPMIMSSVTTAMSLMKSGRVRPIATSGKIRSPALPDVPTIAESGLPGFVLNTWTMLAAPAGTPRDRIAIVQRAIAQAMEDPLVKERMAPTGYRLVGGTPAEARKLLEVDTNVNGQIIRSLGIVPQ